MVNNPNLGDVGLKVLGLYSRSYRFGGLFLTAIFIDRIGLHRNKSRSIVIQAYMSGYTVVRVRYSFGYPAIP